jgi:hypothetical protein
MEWTVVGFVTLEAEGKIRFPKLATKPGLYEFRIQKPGGRSGRYVGETDNLQRRFSHYRNPGPTQLTNLRLNAVFKELLSHDATIQVAIVTGHAWIARANVEEAADFTRKDVRRLFENFILVADSGTDVESLNR